MARNDIRLFKPPAGRNPAVASYGLTAGQTFEEGEVVLVAAAGTLSEAANDPATVVGISGGTSQGKTATGADGSRPAGSQVLVYTPEGNLFQTANLATDGAGTAVTPTAAHIGDTGGFTFLAATTWVLDTGAATTHVEIVDVLDVNGQSLADTNVRTAGTGSVVIFGFI